jgi:hypothetical protein
MIASLAARDSSPAGASFVWDFFDFVETSQDPDVHGTTSTVITSEKTGRLESLMGKRFSITDCMTSAYSGGALA